MLLLFHGYLESVMSLIQFSIGRVDNTFSCDHGGPPGRSQLRHCFTYVRELDRLRNITDFEATNEKRLMRKHYFQGNVSTFFTTWHLFRIYNLTGVF